MIYDEIYKWFQYFIKYLTLNFAVKWIYIFVIKYVHICKLQISKTKPEVTQHQSKDDII